MRVRSSGRLSVGGVSVSLSVASHLFDTDGPWVTSGSRHLGANVVDVTITKAFTEWMKYADVDFQRLQNPILNIKFGVGSHHCDYPFSSSVLAHAFPPRSPSYDHDESPFSLIGDIHFNDDVHWTPQLLYATALHEIGHSLGLPHVSDVNSVMYPILVEGQSFTPQDILTIQSMYGAPPKKNEANCEKNHPVDEQDSRGGRTTTETNAMPQPCTSKVDAVATYRGEFVVFRNEWFWRVINNGQAIYGPNLISQYFTKLPKKVDAAVEIHGQIWIFSGRNFWIFSESNHLKGPHPLVNLGLPETLSRIRLAYQWHYFNPPATYLWSEHEYWKLDIKMRKVEASYARSIVLNWKHVPQHATAAFTYEKELYFIEDDMVFKMNTTDYRLPVSKGFPVSISEFWPFCKERQTISAISVFCLCFTSYAKSANSCLSGLA
ncbi:Hemopexin [Dictyocaulus viviparus]|uniref:Hemopexin n=1 Tax=Dictyocaulus viviparus TaxID=29172 RepID=A0A0D8XFV2_DICVI|nr:Hemopexin [Dictyocaulus viviparus]